MACGGCAPQSLPIIEQNLLPLLGHLWLKGQRELNSVEWCQQTEKLPCTGCLFGRSVATNVSIAAVDVSVLFCCVKEQSKYRSLQMPDCGSSLFVRVMQGNRTAGPGVQELCSKGTSALREGWSWVNVPGGADKLNLCKFAGVELAEWVSLQWAAVVRFPPEKWLHFRRGGAVPVAMGFAERLTGGKVLQQ